jgi:hypothetical protein
VAEGEALLTLGQVAERCEVRLWQVQKVGVALACWAAETLRWPPPPPPPVRWTVF